MKFKEITKRLTGISSPIFGVSWDPKNTSIDVARRIISFLEDRRVLYNPSEMEAPHHCVQSVLEIRNFLTGQIPQTIEKDLVDSLKALRVACRKFLDSVGSREDIVPFGNQRGHWASWEFNGAVGELRGAFGIHIAKIAVMYGLDIEDNLSKILPEKEGSDADPHASKPRPWKPRKNPYND